MQSTQTYSIREFARLAGVTVRTLHFYDEVGLFKPSLHTDANYRRYERKDLVRLQQILTLKHMGFSLKEIRGLLGSPLYDVKRSLHIQKEAIDHQIAQLQHVSAAMEQVLAMLPAHDGADEWDWQLLGQIVRGVGSEDKQRWLARYYTPDQLVALAERRAGIPLEQMVVWQQQWADLIARAEALRHESPAHPAVQAIAGEMHALVQLFTQGDPGLTDSLRRMYEEVEQMPADIRPFDSDLQRFLHEAMRLYEAGPLALQGDHHGEERENQCPEADSGR